MNLKNSMPVILVLLLAILSGSFPKTGTITYDAVYIEPGLQENSTLLSSVIVTGSDADSVAKVVQ
jgi:hypothetical protein